MDRFVARYGLTQDRKLCNQIIQVYFFHNKDTCKLSRTFVQSSQELGSTRIKQITCNSDRFIGSKSPTSEMAQVSSMHIIKMIECTITRIKSIHHHSITQGRLIQPITIAKHSCVAYWHIDRFYPPTVRLVPIYHHYARFNTADLNGEGWRARFILLARLLGRIAVNRCT